MTWVDYVLIVAIVLSALFGFYRGIIKEILSLVGWVFSYWVALKFSHNLTGLFEDMVANKTLLQGISFAALFLVTLIVFMIISFIIGRFIRLSGLGPIDRGIGAVFGLARGALIATLLVFFGNMTPLAAGEAWSGSALVGSLSDFATWATDFRSSDKNRILPPVEESRMLGN
jgi:membrane protein required for colicin V production